MWAGMNQGLVCVCVYGTQAPERAISCRVARHSQQDDSSFVLGNEQLLNLGCCASSA